MNKIFLHVGRSLLVTVWLLSGCATPPPPPQPQMQSDAEMYNNLGIESYRAGSYLAADAMFRRSLQYYESVDDTAGILRTRINLAETALQQHDLAQAAGELQRAAALVSTLKAGSDFAPRIQLLQSTVGIMAGRYNQAADILEPLLPEFTDTASVNRADKIGLSAIANRTRIAFERPEDDADLWTRRFESSLQASGNRDPGLNAQLWRFRATLAQRSGDSGSAARALDSALAEYKRVPSQTGIAATLKEAGDLALQQGDMLQARQYYQRAAIIRIRLTDREATADILDQLAKIENAGKAKKQARSLRAFARDFRRADSPDWNAAQDWVRRVATDS